MYWMHFERVSINQNQLKNRSHQNKENILLFFSQKSNIVKSHPNFITKVWYSILNVQLLFCRRAPSCDNFDKLLGNMHEENHSLTKSSLQLSKLFYYGLLTFAFLYYELVLFMIHVCYFICLASFSQLKFLSTFRRNLAMRFNYFLVICLFKSF